MLPPERDSRAGPAWTDLFRDEWQDHEHPFEKPEREAVADGSK